MIVCMIIFLFLLAIFFFNIVSLTAAEPVKFNLISTLIPQPGNV